MPNFLPVAIINKIFAKKKTKRIGANLNQSVD